MIPRNDLWIVSSHFKEDVSWLNNSGFPFVVVSKGEELPNVREFHAVPNRGCEFGSYIWFILNYWDRLPERVAFVHGHETSYHQQLPVLEAIDIFRNREFCGLNGEFSVAMHRLDHDHVWFGPHFSDMWKMLGLGCVSAPPTMVAMQPGTQCVVSRDLIRLRGRNFWEGVFSVLMMHEHHYHFALVLEIAWHMIFGNSPIDPSCLVDEFNHFFGSRELSALMAHPGRAWNSRMGPVVEFHAPECRMEWISTCMEIFRRFSGNSVDLAPYIAYN